MKTGLFALLLLSGCYIPQVFTVPPGTAPISLATEQTNRTKDATVILPAGTYEASFRNKDGVYYKAPRKFVAKLNDNNTPRSTVLIHPRFQAQNGGIYIPNDNGLPSIWFDERENLYGTSNPEKTFRLKQPLLSK